jgi:hypothetical protein
MIKKMLLAFIFVNTATAQETVSVNNLKTEPVEVSAKMSSVEKKVRLASVKVMTQNGHGSGGLIYYKDMQLVITAQHVAAGMIGSTYLLQTEYEQRASVLIYSDRLHDLAVLYVPSKFSVKGMKWSPALAIPDVSSEITYSGYPSWHSLMTYRGRVAGYETHPEAGIQIMLDSYGWFGCSGSLVYNNDGDPIGVLWGIDLQKGLPQENMIWIGPIQNLDLNLALKPICEKLGNKPKACR